MIISHKYKFIFIKTSKTAGTSIEVYLSPLCGEDDVFTPIQPPVEQHRPRNYKGMHNPLAELWLNRGRGLRRIYNNFLDQKRFYNHMPAAVVRSRVNREVWNSYYKFCVERNPWDKTLSHYHMQNDRVGGGLCVDEFLARGQFPLNYPKYTDAGGRLLVNRVVKYESLIEELTLIFDRLGIPFDGDLGVRVKSGHRKDRRHYRQVLTPGQKEIIDKVFAREIEMHGYVY